MAKPKLGYAIGNSASTTLASGVTNTDTSFPLVSDTNFQAASGAGLVIIDEGQSTEELAYATGVSGGALTIPLANRGLEGGSAQAHSAGATVKGVLSAGILNDIVDSLGNILVPSTGAVDTTKVLTSASPAITTPKITTSINDANGNEVIKTPATSSAVNEITVTNAATENNPQISATGGDTNIDIKLIGKGTGKINMPTLYGAVTTDTDGATITFDCSATNRHQVILGGNRTLALSNYSSGQIIILDLIQDGTGSRTVTWFSGVGLTTTITIAAPGVLTTGQNIPTGTPVVLTTTGALPTGLTASTVYWYTNVSSTTGKLSTSLANVQAGTYITTSGSQSGTHTLVCNIKWPAQTAPTLSTGKYVVDTFGIYVKDASAGVFQGYTIGQNL